MRVAGQLRQHTRLMSDVGRSVRSRRRASLGVTMRAPRERCPSCGRSVRMLQIDDIDERVLVSGRAIDVATKIPGLAGYITTTAIRIHRCATRRSR